MAKPVKCPSDRVSHVVEPTLPGARDSYVDLGIAYDSARLERRRATLKELTARYKAAYAEAYRYLAAAGQLVNPAAAASEADLAALTGRCLDRLPTAAPAPGAIRHVFLDAFCCKGRVFLSDTLPDTELIPIRAGDVDGSALLSRLSEILSSNGHSVTCCHAPLQPTLLRHLLLPDLHIAFSIDPEAESELSLPRPRQDTLRQTLHQSLLSAAERQLTLAKQSHDALEETYNPCVDFSLVRSEAERHIHTIL